MPERRDASGLSALQPVGLRLDPVLGQAEVALRGLGDLARRLGLGGDEQEGVRTDPAADHDPARESNVRFVMPYEEVLAAWRRCIDPVSPPP